MARGSPVAAMPPAASMATRAYWGIDTRAHHLFEQVGTDGFQLGLRKQHVDPTRSRLQRLRV
jgi:hypothetical protein